MFQMKTFQNRWTHMHNVSVFIYYLFVFPSLLITMALHCNERERNSLVDPIDLLLSLSLTCNQNILSFSSSSSSTLEILFTHKHTHSPNITHTTSTLFWEQLSYDTICAWKRSNYDETVFWEICLTTPYLVFGVLLFLCLFFLSLSL